MSDEFDADAFMAEQEGDVSGMAAGLDSPPDDASDLAGQEDSQTQEVESYVNAKVEEISMILTPLINGVLAKEAEFLGQHHKALTEAVAELAAMKAGDGKVEARESGDSGPASPPPMPQLPDGIGMDLEQVAQLLAEKSKTIVSPDDPVLMMVTLLNAFLAEENRLMDRHKKALTEIFATRLDEYVKGVKATSDELGHFLASSTLAAQQKMFTGHHSAMIWTAAIVAVSALVNVAVFVTLFLLRG